MSNNTGMTYASTGVDYDAMDPFKKMAQNAALCTSTNLDHFGDEMFQEFRPSRGESVFLIETPDSFLAHVEEGLGTKNLVADAMDFGDKCYYRQIAQDTVAMIVNDMVTLGALPISVAMHLAVGDSSWFDYKKRSFALIDGWMKACNLARCVWGGGETPTLKDIIIPGTAVLSGSAIGIIKPKERRIGGIAMGEIRAGDSIVIIESSGIHANGLTLARSIADKLPNGYLTELPDGRTYGETLLDPTHIYVGLIEDCLHVGVMIHYAVNITGHGWRKLMRATQPFTYVIDSLPPRPPIFDFLQKHGPIDDREAYGNFNMGAGFALFVDENEVDTVIGIANSLDIRAYDAGYIEEGERRVIIRPVDLEYSGASLAVR